MIETITGNLLILNTKGIDMIIKEMEEEEDRDLETITTLVEVDTEEEEEEDMEVEIDINLKDIEEIPCHQIHSLFLLKMCDFI